MVYFLQNKTVPLNGMHKTNTLDSAKSNYKYVEHQYKQKNDESLNLGSLNKTQYIQNAEDQVDSHSYNESLINDFQNCNIKQDTIKVEKIEEINQDYKQSTNNTYLTTNARKDLIEEYEVPIEEFEDSIVEYEGQIVEYEVPIEEYEVPIDEYEVPIEEQESPIEDEFEEKPHISIIQSDHKVVL